jgi:hypothetical protein
MAILTKVTALFAPIAILVWLVARDRRGLVRFAILLLAEVGVAALVIELLSSGRFSENLGATLFAAQGTPDLLTGAVRLVRLGARDATPIALLVPFAVVGLLLAVHHRRITLVQVALLAAVLVTAVILTEPGAAYNHLLDVTVLLAIAAAEAWQSSQHEQRLPDLVPAVMSTVLGATVFVWLTLTLPGIWATFSRPREPSPAILTARLIGAAGPILSEDAAIPVLADQTPVVLDPFMLVRIGKLHPEWYDSLICRVEREGFSWVVSLQALDAPEARDLYRERRFGAGVHDALLQHYRLSRRIGTYWLYLPRAGRQGLPSRSGGDPVLSSGRCTSDSSSPRGSDTSARSSPTSRQASRPWSTRGGTSTSISRKLGPAASPSARSWRPTSTTTTSPVPASWRR